MGELKWQGSTTSDQSHSSSAQTNRQLTSVCSTAPTLGPTSPTLGHCSYREDEPWLSLSLSSSGAFADTDSLIQRLLSSCSVQADHVHPKALSGIRSSLSLESCLEPVISREYSGDSMSCGPVYPIERLLRCRKAVGDSSFNAVKLVSLVGVVDDASPASPSRLFSKPFQESVVEGNQWRAFQLDNGCAASAAVVQPYFMPYFKRVDQSPQALKSYSSASIDVLRDAGEPITDLRRISLSEFGSQNNNNNAMSSCQSFESRCCGQRSFQDSRPSSSEFVLGERRFTDPARIDFAASASEFSAAAPSEVFPDLADHEDGDPTQKLYPRYVAAFSLANLGLLQGNGLQATSQRRILPFGHPNYFAFLKSLPHNEFVYLATSVARYRRTSRLYSSPSTIVSINLCACCTPHPAPVSSSKFETAFWQHHLPNANELHGVLDTRLSLMLLELHPGLEVVEFLDRRLPAVIRQQVGNRLDRNFVVQIFGVSFMRSHLQNTWTVGDLPECSEEDLQRLNSHPLYHHMLFDLRNRRDLPVFRNINLCPIQYPVRYASNRRVCGQTVLPAVINGPSESSATKSLSTFSNTTSTVCSSDDAGGSAPSLMPDAQSRAATAAAVNVHKMTSGGLTAAFL